MTAWTSSPGGCCARGESFGGRSLPLRSAGVHGGGVGPAGGGWGGRQRRRIPRYCARRREGPAAGDRLSRLRDENLADQAADAAGLDEGSRDRLERLEAGLRALPDAEGSALLLRELDGLTYEEIAKAAGVTSAGAAAGRVPGGGGAAGGAP